MNDVAEFFAMGGDAPYIWSSYGIALIVFVINAMLPRLRRRQVLRQLRRTAVLRERRP